MSIDYYNNNAKKYIEETLDQDMNGLYGLFEKYLEAGARILDIGCGSGRDSRYFKSRGYDVYAHDGSEAMVRKCQEFIGEQAVVARFDEFEPVRLYGESICFKGMWACASLLHVSEREMVSVIDNYVKYLADDGVFFMSFKMRGENHEIGGRSFTNYTEERLLEMIGALDGLIVLDLIKTMDVRDGRGDEGWISVIVGKEISDLYG